MQEIIKKLKLKDIGIVINAPTALEEEFVKLHFEIIESISFSLS